MKKLVIDRQRWLRGEGGGSSALLRKSDQKMCCLGFYCVQNGMPAETITSIGMPSELEAETVDTHPFLSNLAYVGEDDENGVWDTTTCEQLAAVNDDTFIEAPERESKIKDLFSTIDVEVEFVN